MRHDDDGTAVVPIDNPQDLQKIDSIGQLLEGQKVKFAISLSAS